MDVLDMPDEIALVAQRVFPISALPNASFPFAEATRSKPFVAG